MFNFMKKAGGGGGEAGGAGEERDADKERRKREKKERKEREKRERLGSGAEEPLRLEEVRRSLKLRGRRKEKEKLPSGITADYTACFLANLERDNGDYSNYPVLSNSGSNSNLSDENNHLSPNYPTSHAWTKRDVLQSDSSETSLNSLNNPNANTSPKQPPNLPPIPPRPPKRGILKGPRLSNASSNSQESSVPGTDAVDYVNGQDPNLLAKNTLKNELISYNMQGSKSISSDELLQVQNFTKKVIHSPVEAQLKNYQNSNTPITIMTQDCDETKKTNGNFAGVTSTSPSADSLTDTTTNSSFATPPFSMSPVGESQGFHRWSRTSTFEDVYLPLPELTPVVLPRPRVLTIQRQKAPRNDFGFSLRRAIIQERTYCGEPKEVGANGHSSLEDNGYNSGENAKTNGFKSTLSYKAVILAEPGTSNGGHETGLLPGDRLLEVNGVAVDDKTREDVIELIKGSQDSVTIKVQPIAELCELSRRRAADGAADVELAEGNVRGGTLSRSGSRRFGKSQAKSDELLATEQEWLSAQRMWLAHRGGFTAVRREGDADGGRVRVRVLQTGELITVDEDDLEKANPPQLERCEDIASLRCLNECGALHALRARHAAGTPHARAGHALLVLGPPRGHAPIYTDKVASMFRGCRAEDMPPHVFACAQAAHRCMLAARRDRAVVFLGRSGSGKTTAMRHCAWYLATAYPAPATKLTPERLDAVFHCLEAFGNCRSTSNPNASRFVSLASLDFDGGGALVSASVQTLLPDLKPPHEGTFHALQWLVYGCDGRLRRELLLERAPAAANAYVAPAEAGADAAREFAALEAALTRAGASERERRAVWQALAAVCHLGWAGVARAPAGCALKYQWADAASGERAARMLGVAPDELARATFSGAAAAASAAQPPQPAPRNNLRTPSPSMDRELTGAEALDGLVVGLYTEIFNIVAALVNRSLSTSARTSSSILLLDAPGADNPMCAGQQSGAGLSRLMANYLQERLQLVFHEATLVAPRERYAQEGISLNGDGAEDDWMSESVNPGPMVELLDKPPQNTIVRSSQNDLRECDRKGLLWLLDEEAMYPGSSDDTLVERVLAHCGAAGRGTPSPAPAFNHLVRKAPHARQLILQHLQGTNPVLYDVTGWVKASRENPITKKALTLLQESQNEELARLASWARGCGSGAAGATLGDASTLRRASSVRRTLGTAGVRRRSPALQVKFVADGIVDTLRRCGAGGVRFVCCLLTEHRGDAERGDINVPLLRSQFRGFQLLDAARLYKQGFPDHMPLAEFARRYRLLAQAAEGAGGGAGAGAGGGAGGASDRQLAEDMLPALELDLTSYRLGLTQSKPVPRPVGSTTFGSPHSARNMKCKICKVNVDGDSSVPCSQCKALMHFHCSGITEANYKKLSVDRRNAWTCTGCKQRSPAQRSVLTDQQRELSSIVMDQSSSTSHCKSGASQRQSVTAEQSNRQHRDADGSNLVLQELKRIQDQLAVLVALPASVNELRNEMTALKQSVEFSGGVVEDLNKKITSIELKLKTVEKVKAEVDVLSTSVKSIKTEMEQQEQWARRSNIELIGVPEKKTENLIKVISDLAKFTGFDLDPRTDIDFVTRVAPKEPKKGQPKPIVIRMQARYRKDDFLASIRAKCKASQVKSSDIGCGGDSSIVGFDHLTGNNKRLLRLTKETCKASNFKYVWVRNCRILVRQSDTSRIIAIAKEDDLKKLA